MWCDEGTQSLTNETWQDVNVSSSGLVNVLMVLLIPLVLLDGFQWFCWFYGLVVVLVLLNPPGLRVPVVLMVLLGPAVLLSHCIKLEDIFETDMEDKNIFWWIVCFGVSKSPKLNKYPLKYCTLLEYYLSAPCSKSAAVSSFFFVIICTSYLLTFYFEGDIQNVLWMKLTFCWV